MFKTLVKSIIAISFFFVAQFAWAWEKGIYITQPTMESHRIKQLIAEAKDAGITTFIVDYGYVNSRYKKNIQLLKDNNIKYVARVVVFPDGGTEEQVKSKSYWEKKYKLVEAALDMGAQEIQLDYIRYEASRKMSSQNSADINEVIKWFKSKMADKNVPLQIDIFGVSSFGESKAIGQNAKLFANTANTLCPMVYPSHYYPISTHSEKPYETIFTSLKALKSQFDAGSTIKVVPYIEVHNYKYRYTGQKKINYIHQQIKAVEDSGVSGWYAWSPNNKYQALFQAMKTYKVK